MKLFRLAAVLAVCVGLVQAEDRGKPGTKVDKIAVSALDGNPVLRPTQGKLTALVFISTQCPVSNAYNERMQALVNDYASKGVDFVFVNANATESPADVANHAKAKNFTFTVYKDNGNALADQLDAQVTPEVFLVDKTSTIVYHGSIDDSQNPANITKKPLRDALDAVLGGQPVPKAEVKAFGCSIKRAKKAS